ncbi:MAG TPA: hypothetical protein VF001_01895 [Candidatus Limnocylindria bacterium]
MRNVAVAAAAILLVVFGIGVYLVRNQTPTSTALAPPTATLTATPTATPAPTPTPVPTPSPTPVGMYVNPTLKFSFVLPEPYRKSVRLSIASTGGQRPAAADAFTARTEVDEAIPSRSVGETAAAIWNYVAVVDVFTGTGTQSPRDFYNAFSYSQGQKIEDVTVDGHQAVKVTNAPSYPIEYLIKDGDRMFMLGYTIYQPGMFDVPPGATREKLDAILASFKFVP